MAWYCEKLSLKIKSILSFCYIKIITGVTAVLRPMSVSDE